MSKNYKVNHFVWDKYGNIYCNDIIYFKNHERALKYMYKKVKHLINSDDDHIIDTNFEDGNELLKKLINNDGIRVTYDYKISINYQLLGA